MEWNKIFQKIQSESISDSIYKQAPRIYFRDQDVVL